jgi:intracellular sulfur oxidation DsrE/DsrF family protein
MKNYFYIIAPKIKIIYKMETNDKLKIYFDNVDNLLRELYENKVKIQDAGYLIQKSQQERRERTTERKANQWQAGQVGRAEDHL